MPRRIEEIRSEEHAPVAQRIEHLTTDQKVGGSNPFGRTTDSRFFGTGDFLYAQKTYPEDTPGKMRVGKKRAQKTLCQKPRGRAQATAQYDMLQYDTLRALARCSKDASPPDAVPAVSKTAPKSASTCESADLRSQMTCSGAHPPKNA